MPSHRAPDFERLIASVSHALRARGVPYMLIGGQAVLLHGEPRLTQDIDVTLGIAPDGFVTETFVLPCEEPGTGLRVDFIFSTTPYEAQAIDRAVEVEIQDESVRFAAAAGDHRWPEGRAEGQHPVIAVPVYPV